MAKRGEIRRKRSRTEVPSMSGARKKPSKNPKVLVIHYPDERAIRFWRDTMTPEEFVRAVARYSRLVEE